MLSRRLQLESEIKNTQDRIDRCIRDRKTAPTQMERVGKSAEIMKLRRNLHLTERLFGNDEAIECGEPDEGAPLT